MTFKNLPTRINIFGIHFSNTHLEEVTYLIEQKKYDKKGYVCFPSTNTISKAYKDHEFQKVLNNAILTLPDGKITEWYARFRGNKKIRSTSGYWLLRNLLKTDLSHYFYGLNDVDLEKLKNNIETEFPNAKVKGYKAPPFLSHIEFRNNNNDRIVNDIKEINSLKPDIIWIGISTVKQDFLMANNLNNVDGSLMIGVGAVLGYMAGTIKKGPEFLKKIGLRWLFRLLKEPRRLWKSVIPSTYFFIYLVVKDLFKKKLKK